jgi:zinc-binding alcohol dehydrogenase family protein
MKALVYEKAHTLDNFAIKLAEIAEPILRDLDVLVDVHAVGINPGEAFIRKTRSAEPGGRVLLGWEFAGVVAEIGPGVKGFKPGDRVFGSGDMTRDGAWAERVAVDHRIVAKIPDSLSFADASSLPIGAITAWEALFRDQETLPAGVERVLIVGGAGGVGSLATQLLKVKSDAFVISTASRPESRDWCKAMGADLVIDHTKNIEEQLAAAQITTVDLILSTAKTSENLGWIAKILRPFGHLSVIDLSPSLDANALMLKSASLHLEMVFSKILHGYEVESQGDIAQEIANLVAEGRIRPIATTTLHGLTPETMRTAHEQVESSRTVGKVVIAFE